MTKQNLIIFQHPTLYSILKELEQDLNFNLIEANEIDTAIVQRRGLYAKKSMDAGLEIRLEMFDALRPIPKRGVSPMDFYFRASRLRLAQPLEAGECLLLDHVIESF